jgi:tripartite-type tricarboxylate transporter receptor subunit TctC
MRLNTETSKIVQRRDVQEWLVQQGGEAASGSPEEFAARIRAAVEKVEKVVREANLRLE